MAEIPEWINTEAWQGFVAMRKAIKAPLTPRAIELTINKLRDMRSRGLDPNASLDQSTELAWRGVFDVAARTVKAKPTWETARERDMAKREATYLRDTGQAPTDGADIINMETGNVRRLR